MSRGLVVVACSSGDRRSCCFCYEQQFEKVEGYAETAQIIVAIEAEQIGLVKKAV